MNIQLLSSALLPLFELIKGCLKTYCLQSNTFTIHQIIRPSVFFFYIVKVFNRLKFFLRCIFELRVQNRGLEFNCLKTPAGCILNTFYLCFFLFFSSGIELIIKLRKLGLIQRSINAVRFSYKLVMRADFGNLAIVYNHNFVGIMHG